MGVVNVNSDGKEISGHVGIKKRHRLATIYFFLILGFLLFTSGILTLGTKILLRLKGVRTSARIVETFPKEYSGLTVIDRRPRPVQELFFTIYYVDREETSHTVDMYVSKSMYQKYPLGSSVDIIYNPKFPRYSIKFMDTISFPILAVEIAITLTGMAIMIYGWHYSKLPMSRLVKKPNP